MYIKSTLAAQTGDTAHSVFPYLCLYVEIEGKLLLGALCPSLVDRQLYLKHKQYLQVCCHYLA